ncbi:MAG: ClpX C4-type zinc finger protein, partial [Flectobacillus sp.]|nr:ClpX C4-type zinc finger protein [Flectobacillus sp.]
MLLQGVDGHVCSECIEQAHDLLNEELNGPVKGKGAKVKKAAYNVIKPMDMKVFLDQYVIGQDDAKKHLCVAVYNHYKRLMQPKIANDDVQIEKSNIIMVGET